jgi:hypothetical protein
MGTEAEASEQSKRAGREKPAASKRRKRDRPATRVELTRG